MLMSVVLELPEFSVGDNKGIAGIFRDRIIHGEMTDLADSIADLLVLAVKFFHKDLRAAHTD